VTRLSRPSRSDNKKTISLCLAWCTVLWLILSGFRTEADGGRIRTTAKVTETTAETVLCGQLVTFVPATVFSPPGEAVWKMAEGKVSARTPLLLTLSPACLTAAPYDGCFRPVCDGLEAVWDTKAALSYSPVEVEEALTVSPSPPAKAKLEEGFERYYLLLAENSGDKGREEADTADSAAGTSAQDPASGSTPVTAWPEVGELCTLKTEDGLPLRARLLSRTVGNGRILFRFSCPASPGSGTPARICAASLCLAEVNVLSVPVSAVCRDENGQAFVLCDRGDRAVARAVEVLSCENGQALCARGTGKVPLLGETLPCLTAGDTVITDPDGLTHRSLLHRKSDPFSYLRYIINTEKEKKEVPS